MSLCSTKIGGASTAHGRLLGSRLVFLLLAGLFLLVLFLVVLLLFLFLFLLLFARGFVSRFGIGRFVRCRFV